MPAKSVFEQNVKVFPSLHFSEDPLPYINVINGQNGSFRVVAATQDNDYTLTIATPANNATLDITAVGNAITVSLASSSSVASTTAAQLVAALKDVVGYPAIDGLVSDAYLINYDGVNAGTTVPDDIFENQITNGNLNGDIADHTGFKEGLMVIDAGYIDYGVTVTLTLQHSDNGDQFGAIWEDIPASVTTLTHDDYYTSSIGLMRFGLGVTEFKTFLRAIATVTGANRIGAAQISVVFLLAGRGYFDAEDAQEMAFVL